MLKMRYTTMDSLVHITIQGDLHDQFNEHKNLRFDKE